VRFGSGILLVPNDAKMKKKPNKRVTPRAASLTRIAKTLRIRAIAYNRMARASMKAKDVRSQDHWYTRSMVCRDLASEFDNEARTLRAQR